MSQVPAFEVLIGRTRRSAVHLEMRDSYTPDDPDWLDWCEGRTFDPAERMRPWFDLIKRTVGRGVTVRRARIVSEPLAPYIRFEYDVTGPLNVAAGEQVGWLSRRFASDLALPGNDFWVFDDQLVRFGHFAGDGTFLDHEVADDPRIVRLCSSAFEAVWDRATPHQDYRPA